MTSIQSNDAMPTVSYQLLSITPATAPSDSGGTWFRYVIVQGANEITGLRTGSANEVEFAVREMVDRLNERSRGKDVKKTTPAPAAAQAVSNPAVDQS